MNDKPEFSNADDNKNDMNDDDCYPAAHTGGGGLTDLGKRLHDVRLVSAGDAVTLKIPCHAAFPPAAGLASCISGQAEISGDRDESDNATHPDNDKAYNYPVDHVLSWK